MSGVGWAHGTFPWPADRRGDATTVGDVDGVAACPVAELGWRRTGFDLDRPLLADSFDGGRLCGCPVVGGGQVAIGPLFGQAAGLAEDYGDVGPADLAFGEPFGDERGPDPVLFVDLR